MSLYADLQCLLEVLQSSVVCSFHECLCTLDLRFMLEL